MSFWSFEGLIGLLERHRLMLWQNCAAFTDPEDRMEQKNPERSFWMRPSKMFQPLIVLILPLIWYSLLITFPVPLSITASLYGIRAETCFLITGILWLLFRRKGLLWETVSLAAVLGLFACSLIYKWQTAQYDGNLIGGMLPWSDATDYFRETYRLLEGMRLSMWGTRRPIFASLLSVLFRITDCNLQLSIAILVALNGMAIYAAAREIRRAYGAFAAAIFTTLGYLFYRSWAGTTLTENIGLALGALGLSLLVRSAREKNFKLANYGLFVLTIAMNARAGALFILPVLAIWIYFVFRSSIPPWKTLTVSTIAIVLGFGGNFILVRTLGAQGSVPFSNYSYVFYGLASGNKGWTQVLTDHPQAQEADIPRLAIEKFKEDPARLLKGITLSYSDYVKTHGGAFGFVRLASFGDGFNILLWALTVCGLWICVWSRRSPIYSLLLAGIAGVLASVSLVPPIDADSMRAYAATIPVTACLVAAGIGIFGKVFGSNPENRVAAIEQDSLDLSLSLSIALVGICIVLPPLLPPFERPPVQNKNLTCAPGDRNSVMVVGRGSFVNLIRDDEAQESYLPNIRISDFRKPLVYGSGYPLLDRELLQLQPGQSIGITSTQFVVSEPDPLSRGIHSVCATPASTEWLRAYNFFYVKSHDKSSMAATMLSKYPSIAKLFRILGAVGFILIIFWATAGWLRDLPPRRKNSIIAAEMTLAILGVLIYLHCSATLPLQWERKSLDSLHAIHEQGFCYMLPLGVDGMSQSNSLSMAEIFENGEPFGVLASSHNEIIVNGGGRYAFGEGYLHMSTSDGSDPKINGRKYEIYWPTPIPPFVENFVYLCVLGLLARLFFRQRAAGRDVKQLSKRRK
jgi:hypothetical protein